MMVPKQQNGSLTFRSEADMKAAKRLLKGARVRYPGVIEEWKSGNGVWRLGFPGTGQLTVRAYWENALDTAGVDIGGGVGMSPNPETWRHWECPDGITRIVDIKIAWNTKYYRMSKVPPAAPWFKKKVEAYEWAKANGYLATTPAPNPKRKKAARDYSPGTIMRFDGKALDNAASGFFDVEVVNWNQGSEHNGRVPYALVRSVRTGKEFLAYQYMLHEKAANPSRLPRPSLIGTIADAYFPFDAMEQTVRGAVEDVRRLGNPDTSPIEQWPIWRYVLAPLGAYVTDWRAASTRSDYSTLHLNGRSVTLRGSDHWNFNNPTTSRTAREASTLRYTAPGFERAVALWAGYTESQLKGLNLKTQRDLKILGSRSPENAV